MLIQNKAMGMKVQLQKVVVIKHFVYRLIMSDEHILQR